MKRSRLQNLLLLQSAGEAPSHVERVQQVFQCLSNLEQLLPSCLWLSHLEQLLPPRSGFWFVNWLYSALCTLFGLPDICWHAPLVLAAIVNFTWKLAWHSQNRL